MNKPIIAVSTAGLLALAACGGSSGSGSTTPTQTTSSQFGHTEGTAGSGKNPNAVGPAAPVAGAKTGGTVYVESAVSPNTFDPTDAYYVDSSSILEGLVTRSLTQYQYDPKTGNFLLVPDLATNLGVPNKNFTSWTFTLKKGIKFQDGTPVTPADIKYGIERSFDRATFVNGANYSNQYFLDGNTYKGPYKSGTNYPGVIIKGQNITIKMSKPFPDMPYWGAFPAMGPIKPTGSSPSTYKNDPLATGPYKFNGYTPGKSLTLVRNKYWNPKTDPARHAYPDEWKFTWAGNPDTIQAGLLHDQGQAQSTLTYDNVLGPMYSQFKNDPSAASRLVTGTSPCTYMLYPDNRTVPKPVRQALAWAWPYKSVWLAGGSLEGVTIVPAYNMMPPGIPGRKQYNPLPGHTPGTTNAAKAKQILTQSHHLGFKISMGYETDQQTSIAEKNQWVPALKKAGFNPQPVASTSTNIRTLISSPTSKVNVRSVGWCSDWPGGASWIPPEFQSTDISKVGFGTNYEAYNQKWADQAMAHVQTLPLSQQPAAWNALEQQIMTKDFPVVLTGYGADAMIRGSKIGGMFNDSTFAMPT
ncbi:MAG: ABC transporter substrate-binding protein, partial [Nocardioidaceae bacterium]